MDDPRLQLLDPSEGPARDGTAYVVTVGTVKLGCVWQETVHRPRSYVRRGARREDRLTGSPNTVAHRVWAHDLDEVGGHATRADAVTDLVRRWSES